MNVMAEAHKLTRETLEVLPHRKYRETFIIMLKGCHREYKAMKKEMTAEQKMGIAHCESVIAKYNQVEDKSGFVQVFPKSMMLVNAEVGCIANVNNVPRYESIVDANLYNGRVGNGSGEVCEVMVFADYIKKQIEAMQQAIIEIKKG